MNIWIHERCTWYNRPNISKLHGKLCLLGRRHEIDTYTQRVKHISAFLLLLFFFKTNFKLQFFQHCTACISVSTYLHILTLMSVSNIKYQFCCIPISRKIWNCYSYILQHLLNNNNNVLLTYRLKMGRQYKTWFWVGSNRFIFSM